MDWLIDILWTFVGARLLNSSPTMSRNGDLLVVKSNWRQQLWTLGFGDRRIEIDRSKKIVHIFDRRFWLIPSSRRIQFDWVSQVTWGYTPLSTGFWARYEYDLFSVGLNLKDGQRVHLFRFFGMGDFVNDSIWPDFFYWSDFLTADLNRGPQTSASRSLAEILSGMIGVGIVDPAD